MTWCELRTFVRHVPPDSAYGREVLGVEKATFTGDTSMLMQIANILIKANSEKEPPESELFRPPE